MTRGVETLDYGYSSRARLQTGCDAWPPEKDVCAIAHVVCLDRMRLEQIEELGSAFWVSRFKPDWEELHGLSSMMGLAQEQRQKLLEIARDG
jgi:hypothetical protein